MTDLGQHNGHQHYGHRHNGHRHNGHRHDGHTATDPAQLERDIARQRDQLSHTIDALSRKLDVKHRAEVTAHDTAARIRDAATTDSGQPRPDLLAVGAAVVAGVALLVWWRTHS